MYTVIRMALRYDNTTVVIRIFYNQLRTESEAYRRLLSQTPAVPKPWSAGVPVSHIIPSHRVLPYYRDYPRCEVEYGHTINQGKEEMRRQCPGDIDDGVHDACCCAVQERSDCRDRGCYGFREECWGL